MDIETIRLLIDIRHRGSFAEAARERGLDPSRVSRAVAAVEAELGLRLFQRTTRRVEPTEAGELYLRRLATIAEDLERARDDAQSVSQGPVGLLRLTTTVAFGQQAIVPLLPDFRRAHPKVDIDLVLSDGNLDLVRERIDLAVRLGASVGGDLVVSKLRDTVYRVCAAPDHLAAFGRPERPSDLVGRDCLRFNLPGFRDRWIFAEAAGGEPFEVPISGGIVASGALALRSLAIAGLGPALLADWLVDEDIAAGRLVDLFPGRRVTATTFETAVWMLYPSRSFLPRKVRAMIDFLRARLG
ncbi:MAG: LysR family transcriptional regulator [Hyphomicrobiales bacterium]|nr:LysR family transcriptional regulator [Hyphomicrobiales bacterium]